MCSKRFAWLPHVQDLAKLFGVMGDSHIKIDVSKKIEKLTGIIYIAIVYGKYNYVIKSKDLIAKGYFQNKRLDKLVSFHDGSGPKL